jgi:prepilin-type N-terminal cleavage/methylation domain-containing protein
MNSSYRSKNAGFTLIEVMITVAILAFISLGIFQAVTSSFKLRDELVHEADFFTGIRLAMGIMNRDVTMIYSPILLMSPQQSKSNPNDSSQSTTNPSGGSSSTSSGTSNRDTPQFDESQIAASTAADLARSFTFWSAAADKSGLRPSRFVGTESKMTFISANHFRVYKDAPESEFEKVTYEIQPDSEPPINGFKVDGSNVLVKMVSANVFDNDDLRDREFTHKYSLLRGITSCKFTYYRWKDNSLNMVNSWDSDKEDFKWQIPDMIQVEIEVKGPTGLSYSGLYQFKPELPFHGLNPSF